MRTRPRYSHRLRPAAAPRARASLVSEGRAADCHGERTGPRAETRRLPALSAVRRQLVRDSEGARREIHAVQCVSAAMNMIARSVIASFSAEDVARPLAELGALLHACVFDGASVGFVLPYTQAEAETFWRAKVMPKLREGGLLLLIAQREGRLAG